MVNRQPLNLDPPNSENLAPPLHYTTLTHILTVNYMYSVFKTSSVTRNEYKNHIEVVKHLQKRWP